MNEFYLLIFAVIILLALAAWAAVYYATYAVRSQILGETIWRGRAENNSVALTFDDGPSPDTEDLLDVLKRENIKATFFLVGEMVEKYPETARRIVSENHEIGNHSYSHPIYLFCRASRTRNELEKTQKIIENVTGVAPRLALPPCGVRSTAYFAATKNLGLRTVQWSDTGFDWKDFSAEKIAQKVLETARSDSIILLHDGDSAGRADRKRTVEAVSRIVKGLRKKNLRVAPLAEIIAAESFNENNLMEKTILTGKSNPFYFSISTNFMIFALFPCRTAHCERREN